MIENKATEFKREYMDDIKYAGFLGALPEIRLPFRPFFIAEKKGYGAYTTLHAPF